MRESKSNQNSVKDKVTALVPIEANSRDEVIGECANRADTNACTEPPDTLQTVPHHTETSEPPVITALTNPLCSMPVTVPVASASGNQCLIDAGDTTKSFTQGMVKENQDVVNRVEETSASSLPLLLPVTRTSVPLHETRGLSPASVPSASQYTPSALSSNILDLSTASNHYMLGISPSQSRRLLNVPLHSVPGGLSFTTSSYQHVSSLNDRYLSPVVTFSGRASAVGSMTSVHGISAFPAFHSLERTSSLPNVPAQASSSAGISCPTVYQMMRHTSLSTMSSGLSSTPVSQSPVARTYPYTSEAVPLSMSLQSTPNKDVALTGTSITQSPLCAPSVNLFQCSSNIIQGSASSMAAGVNLSAQNNVGAPFNGNRSGYGSISNASVPSGHNINTFESVPIVGINTSTNVTQGGVPNTNMPTWTNISDHRGVPKDNTPSRDNISQQGSLPDISMPTATNILTPRNVSNVNVYSGSNISMPGTVQNISVSTVSVPASSSVTVQGGALNANMLYGSNVPAHGNVSNVGMTARENITPHGSVSNVSLPPGGVPAMNFPTGHQPKSRLSAGEGNVEKLVIANKLNGNSHDPLVLDANHLLSNLKVDTVESLHQLLETFNESERNLTGTTYLIPPNQVNESICAQVQPTSIQSAAHVSVSGCISSTRTSSTSKKPEYLTGDELIRAAANFSEIPTNLPESEMRTLPVLSAEGNGYELDVNLTIVHDENKEKEKNNFEAIALAEDGKKPSVLMPRSQVNALHKSVSLYWPDFSAYPQSCICEPGIGKEIAVEQIWMHEKQLYFMPQIEIITVSNQELVGILKVDNVYVSVGQIFLHLLPEMKKEIENYLVSKECDRAFLSLEEMAYLQQRKCININSATVISLASLRTMCTSLIEGKSFVDSPTINLYEAANGTYYRKILSKHTRCSNCGGSIKDETVPDDYEEFDSPQLPISNTAMKEAYQNLLTKRTEERKKNLDNVVQKDGKNLIKEIKVGTTTVGHVHFNVFIMDSKMYISIRELVLSKVMTIQGLQSRLVELKYKPRPAPSTVDLYFISENIDVDNTLWIDLETLRCVCCIKLPAPKGWNMGVYNRLKLKQYSFQEDATFHGEDDCAWEGVVYTLNTVTFKIATTKLLTSKIIALPPKSFDNKEKQIPKRVRSKYGKGRKWEHENEIPEGKSVDELLHAAGGSRRNKLKVKGVKAVKNSGDPVYMSVSEVLKPGYYVFKDKESIQRFLNASSPSKKDSVRKTNQSMPTEDVVQILDFGSQSSDSSPNKHREAKSERKRHNSKGKKSDSNTKSDAALDLSVKKGLKKGNKSTKQDPKKVRFRVVPARSGVKISMSTKQREKELPDIQVAKGNACESLNDNSTATCSRGNTKTDKEIDENKDQGSREQQHALPHLRITLSKISDSKMKLIKYNKEGESVAASDTKSKENLSTDAVIEKDVNAMDLSTKSSVSNEHESLSKKRKRKRENSSERKSKKKCTAKNDSVKATIEQRNETAESHSSPHSLHCEDLSSLAVDEEKTGSPKRKKQGRKPYKNKSDEKDNVSLSEVKEKENLMEGIASIAATDSRIVECFSNDLNSEICITDSDELLNKVCSESEEMKSPKRNKKKRANKPKEVEDHTSTLAGNNDELSNTCQKQVSVPISSERMDLLEENSVSEVQNDTSDISTKENVGFDKKEVEDATKLLDNLMQSGECGPVQNSQSVCLGISKNSDTEGQDFDDIQGRNSDHSQLVEVEQHEEDVSDREEIPAASSEGPLVTKPQDSDDQIYAPTILQTVEDDADVSDSDKPQLTESKSSIRAVTTESPKLQKKEVKKGRKKDVKMTLLSSKPDKSERKKLGSKIRDIMSEVHEDKSCVKESSSSSEINLCDSALTDTSTSSVCEISEKVMKVRDTNIVTPASPLQKQRKGDMEVQNENSACDGSSEVDIDKERWDVDMDYYEKHPAETKYLLKKLFGILDICVDFNGNFEKGFDVSNFYLKTGAEEYFPCLMRDDLERRKYLLHVIYEAFKNVSNLPSVSVKGSPAEKSTPYRVEENCSLPPTEVHGKGIQSVHDSYTNGSNIVGMEISDEMCGSDAMEQSTDPHQGNSEDQYNRNNNIETDFRSPPMSRDYMQSLGLIESSKLHLLSPPRRLRSSKSDIQIKLLDMELISKGTRSNKHMTKRLKGHKINKLTSLKSKYLMPKNLKGYHVSAHRKLQEAILAKSGKSVKCTRGLKELKNLCTEMNEGSGKLRSGIFKRSLKKVSKLNRDKTSRGKEKDGHKSKRARSASPQKRGKEKNGRRSLEKQGPSKISEKLKRSNTKALRQSKSLDRKKRKTSVKLQKIHDKSDKETFDRCGRSREAKSIAENAIKKTTVVSNVNASSEKVLASKKDKDLTSLSEIYGLKRAYVSLQRQCDTLENDTIKVTSMESKEYNDKTEKLTCNTEIAESLECHDEMSKLNCRQSNKQSPESESKKIPHKSEKLGRNAARISQSKLSGKSGKIQHSPPGLANLDTRRLASEVITAREAKRRRKLMLDNT